MLHSVVESAPCPKVLSNKEVSYLFALVNIVAKLRERSVNAAVTHPFPEKKYCLGILSSGLIELIEPHVPDVINKIVTAKHSHPNAQYAGPENSTPRTENGFNKSAIDPD